VQESTNVQAVAFSPDGKTLATGDYDGETFTWNVATTGLLATLTDPDGVGVWSAAFSPHGEILATGDGNGNLYLWHVR
jgi:WD40 repeat protein